MSPVTVLRSYTFNSEEAAQESPTFFKRAKVSLRENHNVSITGFFISRTNPTQVMVFLEYPSGSQIQEVTRDYQTSEAFKKDSEGVNMRNAEKVEEQILEAMDL